MPKLELSLKVDYVPNWDFAAGIRELVSNARDAEIQFSAPMTIDWRNNTLRIENEGATLPREALLFGHTTKVGMSNLVGQHGEGMKVGSLVLIRNGYTVKIRSGSEIWSPAIERSEKFNANVLVFNIAEGRKAENRVRVEIGGISKEQWEKLRERFLFLDKVQDKQVVKTSSGQLLLDEKYKGKIFVKGIFVQQTESQYGYSLDTAELDRDRRMVDSYDLKYNVNQIWIEALNRRPDLLDAFYQMFDGQKEDVEGLNEYSASSYSSDVLSGVVKKFSERYGENALPVASLEQSRELEHYGRKGVIVSRQLAALLNVRFGNFETMSKKLRHETSKMYSWSDLTKEEQQNLTGVIDRLHSVSSLIELSLVDIVEFKSPNMEGLYRDGRVQIRRDFVSDYAKLMQVAIHEFAHHTTAKGDGTKQHVNAIEELWMAVFRQCSAR